MSLAMINHMMLHWAMRRAEVGEASMSSQLKIPQQRFRKWLTGEEHPPFGKAENLAKRLRIPLGYLFLKKPPEEKIPIPDLRVVSHNKPLTIDFRDVLNDTLQKRDWLRDELLTQGSSPLRFIGKFNAQRTQVQEVAGDIIDTIGLKQKFPRRDRSWSAFLNRLVDLIEDAGIYVLRNGIVGSNSNRSLSIEEFRGFCIADSVAPIIFINNKDSVAARIFTLIHEVAHLWLGKSGISNLTDGATFPSHDVEGYCNRIAVEILVPESDFRKAWAEFPEINEMIEAAVIRYRVSSIVILRRALELGLIDRDTFFSQMEAETGKQKKSSFGRLSYDRIMMNRNSPKLSKMIIRAVDGGDLPRLDAYKLLNCKAESYERLSQKILGR